MAAKAPVCLSCRLASLTIKPTRVPKRTFTTTPPRTQRRRPAYPSVKATADQLRAAESTRLETLATQLKPYTPREKELLALRYTPEQMAAIEAGEEAVNVSHMVMQGRLRGDAGRVGYMDDFATMRPLVDFPPDPAGESIATGGKKEKVKAQKIPGVAYSTDEADPHLTRLALSTGLSRDQIRRIRVKTLVSHRVVNQTRMGKIQSLYFLTIAGNQDGMVGVGEGKAAEDEDGRRQAMMSAIRNMRPVARYEERTIYGEVEGKVGGSVVKLSARPPGTFHLCMLEFVMC